MFDHLSRITGHDKRAPPIPPTCRVRGTPGDFFSGMIVPRRRTGKTGTKHACGPYSGADHSDKRFFGTASHL